MIYGLFIVVVVARSALFINNLPQLPRTMGFDAEAHEQYVQFIQEKHALPLPTDGWEMYQPPLYYAASALLLGTFGLSVDDGDATNLLRAMNGVIGLIHCWLALLCLRLLFPENPSAQAVGLLVAAFLPPHLYLSQYVTNEPLTGLCVTVALYLCLRALQSEKENLRLHLGIGLALGAAMLTKFSSLLAIPVFLTALGLRLVSRKNYAARDWLGSLGVVAFTGLVVCGWHYGRVWARFGRPILGNWEADAFAWWQDPGFRTSAFYFGFGQAFVTPFFSGFYHFADGMYSTLWGDGLASGTAVLAFRPPWNYDLMNAGYLLAIAIFILFLTGLAIALLRFVRQLTVDWFVVLGTVFLFVLGIVYMSLRVPSYAQVKAFYAFPALVPFSALVAVGWNWLAQKHRVLQTALWVILLVWAITAYAAFWVRSGNPETYRVRGIQQIKERNYVEAAESLSHALKLNPNDADAHCALAAALSGQNKMVEATQQCHEALRLRADFPEALNYLAGILATSGDNQLRDGARAVNYAERACKLTLYETPGYVSTLAAAYTAAGRFDDAISAGEEVCALASESGEQDLLKKNQVLLAANLNNLAWTLATSKEIKIMNGTRAVQLAERACELTHYRETIMVGTLAAAYAEAGRFDDAMATAQKACALAEASGQPELSRKNQELLELYRAHKAYHETR